MTCSGVGGLEGGGSAGGDTARWVPLVDAEAGKLMCAPLEEVEGLWLRTEVSAAPVKVEGPGKGLGVRGRSNAASKSRLRDMMARC